MRHRGQLGGFHVRHQSRAAIGGLADYVAIARPDHWIKHVLIIPGVAFAMIMSQTGPVDVATLAERLVACLLVAMALSSANYTINEWLDAPFDAMHPTKRARPAVQTVMSPTIVFAQYIILTTIGMLIANTLGHSFAAGRRGVRGVRRDLQCAPDPRQGPRLRRRHRRVPQQSPALPVRLVRGGAAHCAANLDPARLLVRRRLPDGRKTRLRAPRHRRGRRHRQPRGLPPLVCRLHPFEPGHELPRLRPGFCLHDGDLPSEIPHRISRRDPALHCACSRPICAWR